MYSLPSTTARRARTSSGPIQTGVMTPWETPGGTRRRFQEASFCSAAWAKFMARADHSLVFRSI
jgi:hypothetical protein